jgi:hypothetical protein
VKPFAIRVAMETQRPRRKRVSTDQLARCTGPVTFDCALRLDVHSQAPRLAFTSINGKVRIAEDETTDDVSSSRDRLQRELADVRAHPVVLTIREDRASRENCPQVVERNLLARAVPGVLAHAQVGGAGAKYGHLLVRDDRPQCVRGSDRVRIEDDLGAGRER